MQIQDTGAVEICILSHGSADTLRRNLEREKQSMIFYLSNPK